MIKVTQTRRWSFEKLQEQLPYFGSLRFFLPLKRRIKWKFVVVKKPFIGEGSGSIFQLFFLVRLPPQQHWQCRWTLSPSQDVPVCRSRSCRVISANSINFRRQPTARSKCPRREIFNVHADCECTFKKVELIQPNQSSQFWETDGKMVGGRW